MKVTKVDLDSTGFFSNAFLDYLSQDEKLSSFYAYTPDLSGFNQKLKDYSFDIEKRKNLSKIISAQYEGLQLQPFLQSNINSITEGNTFTVTTGHQLNIFTGPLYFIYKIITVINLSKKLKQEFPENNYIPVYWMASEDHDFEEINHFLLFGKKFTWSSEQKGAVGRFDTSGILTIFDQIQEELPLFKKAYSEYKTLSAATRFFVNELFGAYGLLVIDADDRELKSSFNNVIKDELLNQTSSKIVGATTQNLEELGYKSQVNSREINLFYLDKNLRERIVKEGNTYKVNSTDISFSQLEILALVDQEPEKFSPNVLLRPLYEESILPNICYTGGPAEIVYWLQLKNLFHHYSIPFPVLIPRNFVLYINKAFSKKLQKLSVAEADLFLREDLLISKFLSTFSEEKYLLEPEKNNIDNLFQAIGKKAELIDSTLVGYVLSEKQKSIKSIEEIEKKLKKAEQKKNTEVITQLTGLKSKLFPENSLQERKENFLNFMINDPDFINKMMDALDPLEFSFNVISEEVSA